MRSSWYGASAPRSPASCHASWARFYSLIFNLDRDDAHIENVRFLPLQSDLQPLQFLFGSYSVHLRKSRAPLVPPKPNEFDMAYSNSVLRAWLGTKSMPSVPGS